MMLFSDMGGIDIEEVAEKHPDHVGRGHLSNLLPIPDFRARRSSPPQAASRAAS